MIENLTQLKIASGYGFLEKRAGFNQASSIIPYNDDATNGYVLFASLVNLVFISVLCLITATVLGFSLGFARLSKNWLIAKLALCYVEFFRNIPPLVLLFFWAFGILQILPPARQSLFWGPLIVNVRGIYLPAPVWGDGIYSFLSITMLAWIIGLILAFFAHRQKHSHGRSSIKLWHLLAFFLGIPLAAFSAFAWPKGWDVPQLRGFNYKGGFYISPEFISLYLALSIYTTAVIAETVRAGLLAVDHSLKEAGTSLGLNAGLVNRLITLPLAMRVIIPPLASQYMSLIKNTSLGAAVGYSELMMVSSTIIEKTGQAVELALIWVIVYLGLSLFVSVFMNWFNKKMAVVER
ncbi:amino acid ABC transporter permease [Bartonella sp. DGB2]|uniref:amino acid ABC transporter permease n=1 Tax=Bartonella sp. DGB2 TaxID=3388426 RepID=UPI00398FE956